jgi:hypothetical protein
MECNGPEKYSRADSLNRLLAENIRGMDVIRAISLGEETIFGRDEWDCLGTPGSDKVFLFVKITNKQPINSIFRLYAKVANIACRSKRTEPLTVEEMPRLVNRINALKNDLEKWRQDLPAYYEPIYIPSQCLNIDESVNLMGYPYESRLDYVASNNPLLCVTNGKHL